MTTDPCLEKYWQIFVYFKYHNSQRSKNKSLFFKKNCLLNFHSALMRFFKILLKTAIHPGSLTMEYHALLYFTIQWSMQYITCGAGTKMCLPVASFGYITCFVGFFSTSTSTSRGGDSLHWRERVDWVTWMVYLAARRHLRHTDKHNLQFSDQDYTESASCNITLSTEHCCSGR